MNFGGLENWFFPYRSESVADLDEETKQTFLIEVEKCPRCNEPSPNHQICGACISDPPAFDATQTVYRLNDPLKELIHQYKYGGQLYFSRLFAELMLEAFDWQNIDALIPIPLHPKRLSDRGFNQSLEIARVIHQKTAIPLVLDGLTRIEDTPHQAQLNREQRVKNLKGAFAINQALPDAVNTIALIDDVITTGSTMEQAAKLLKKRYPNIQIEAWAIAKASR